MPKASIFPSLLHIDDFLEPKRLFSRKLFKSVILSAAVGGAVISIVYWWFKSRRSVKHSPVDSEVCDIDDPTALGIHSIDFYSQTKYSSNRSAGSVLSRTSTISGKRTAVLSARRPSQSYAGNDSDIDDSSSSALDYRRLGLRALAGVVEHLESLMSKVRVLEEKGLSIASSDSEQLINDLRLLLEHAYRLREQYKQQLVLHDGSYRQGSLESLVTSQEDTSSYFSASEQLDLTELELLMQFNVRRPLYYNALKLLNEGEVPYRALRTQFVGCELDIEYLGKVHCLRQAFDYIFSHPESTEWIIKIGKLNVCRLLHCLGYPTTDFEEAYERLMDFIRTNRNQSNNIMYEELYAKGVKVINFYDIVIDMMLLEGFQLLSNPPQSILSVTRHKWLSDNFKRCALDSTVWTILLTKRKMLKYPNGFYAYYYSMIGTLLPGLAWGYLGPNEAYFNLCDHFREIILSFIRELFISYDDSNQCSFICTNGKQYDIDEDHHKVNSCLVNYSLNKEVANSTISSNNQDNNNNIDDTLSESGPTLVYKMDELDNQLINYRQKIGLRYTTINELSNDLYQLINIYSQQLLNIFLNESQLCNNPLTNELNTNPIQPELDLNCVL